jgi:hypothetical protein
VGGVLYVTGGVYLVEGFQAGSQPRLLVGSA